MPASTFGCRSQHKQLPRLALDPKNKLSYYTDMVTFGNSRLGLRSSCFRETRLSQLSLYLRRARVPKMRWPGQSAHGLACGISQTILSRLQGVNLHSCGLPACVVSWAFSLSGTCRFPSKTLAVSGPLFSHDFKLTSPPTHDTNDAKELRNLRCSTYGMASLQTL